MTNRDYFYFIFDMAETLLENGAEIRRVEATIQHTSKAVGIENVDCFLMINGIMMTSEFNGEILQAKVQEVPISPINLGRIEAVNVLSRDLSQNKIGFEEAKARLEEIKNRNYSTNRAKFLGYIFASGAFCFLFGGNIYDVLGALFLGVALGTYVLWILPKLNFSDLLTNLSCSILVTTVACLIVKFFPHITLPSLITGGIVSLLPGVAFVNSIRYFFDEDYLSGWGMMMDAIVVASMVATGVAIVLRIFQ